MTNARLLPYAFARDFALLAQRGVAVDSPVEVWISDKTPPVAVAEVSRCFGRVRLKSMPREALDAEIAKAYAGSGGDAAQVIDEYESDLDLNKNKVKNKVGSEKQSGCPFKNKVGVLLFFLLFFCF